MGQLFQEKHKLVKSVCILVASFNQLLFSRTIAIQSPMSSDFLITNFGDVVRGTAYVSSDVLLAMVGVVGWSLRQALNDDSCRQPATTFDFHQLSKLGDGLPKPIGGVSFD